MKTEKNQTAELVQAAQLAGADEDPSAEFWRQVAAHAGVRNRPLVEPRNLLAKPKAGTI